MESAFVRFTFPSAPKMNNYQDKNFDELGATLGQAVDMGNIRVCSEEAALDWLEDLADRLCLFGGRSLGGGDGGSEDLVGIPDPKGYDSRRWLGVDLSGGE